MKLNGAKETVATTFVMFMILFLLYQNACNKTCYLNKKAHKRIPEKLMLCDSAVYLPLSSGHLHSYYLYQNFLFTSQTQ